MIILRDKSFSHKMAISSLMRKNNGMSWDEKERINEALEGAVYRQNRREGYRQQGIKKAQVNVLGASSQNLATTDVASNRAAELAKARSHEAATNNLIQKRYKKLVQPQIKMRQQ